AEALQEPAQRCFLAVGKHALMLDEAGGAVDAIPVLHHVELVEERRQLQWPVALVGRVSSEPDFIEERSREAADQPGWQDVRDADRRAAWRLQTLSATLAVQVGCRRVVAAVEHAAPELRAARQRVDPGN